MQMEWDCSFEGTLYVLVPVTGKTEDPRMQGQQPDRLTAWGQLLKALYINPVHIF